MFKFKILIYGLGLFFMPVLSHADEAILGEWFPDKTSKGGLGAARTYYKDGKVELVMGAVLKSTYQLNGAELVLNMKGETEPLRFKVEFLDKKLKMINQKDQKEKVLARVDESRSKGLIGKWSTKSSYGGTENYIFMENKTCFIQVSLKSQIGQFVVKENQLFETFDEQKITWDLVIEEDQLKLTSLDKNKIASYIRVHKNVNVSKRKISLSIFQEMMKSRTPEAKYKRAMDKLKKADTTELRYTALEDAAKLSFDVGEIEGARVYSIELESMHDTMKKNMHWAHGKAIHTSNMVLGRIALQEGDLEQAKDYLLKSVEPLLGLPQKQMSTLTSFGPNLSLVKDLLEKEEWDVVVEYFKLCQNFWKNPRSEKFYEDVKMKRMPKFGANLVY